MSTLEEKAVELVSHFEWLVFRYIMTEQQTPALCGGQFNRQEIRVVHALGKLGACSMSEIADRLMLAVSSTTSVIDKLVEKNVVSRERSGDDRRIVHVELTDEGRRIYEAAREGRMHMGRAMLAMLTETEQNDLLDLFRKMTRDMVQSPSGRVAGAHVAEAASSS